MYKSSGQKWFLRIFTLRHCKAFIWDFNVSHSVVITFFSSFACRNLEHIWTEVVTMCRRYFFNMKCFSIYNSANDDTICYSWVQADEIATTKISYLKHSVWIKYVMFFCQLSSPISFFFFFGHRNMCSAFELKGKPFFKLIQSAF